MGGKEEKDERVGGGGNKGCCNCTLDAPLWWQGRRWGGEQYGRGGGSGGKEDVNGRRDGKLLMGGGFK